AFSENISRHGCRNISKGLIDRVSATWLIPRRRCSACNGAIVTDSEGSLARDPIARGSWFRRQSPDRPRASGYGTGIGLAEVVELDQERFEQKVHAVLLAD